MIPGSPKLGLGGLGGGRAQRARQRAMAASEEKATDTAKVKEDVDEEKIDTQAESAIAEDAAAPPVVSGDAEAEAAEAASSPAAPAAEGAEASSKAAPAASADASADSAAATTSDSADKPAEGAAERVARLWKEHTAKDEKFTNADRLTQSSAYRQWVKTAELGLPQGVEPPPFTEVWLLLNPPPTIDSGGRRRRSRSRRNDRRQRDAGKATGSKAGDPLADFAAEANPVYKKDGEEPGGSSSAAAKSSKTEEGADKAGEEASADRKGDAAELERELDKRAAEKRKSRDRERSLGSRLDGPLASSRERKTLDVRRRERKNEREDRRGATEQKYTKEQSIEMLDAALQKLCEDGIHRELPINASVLNDRMRRIYFGWHISASPFDRYSELLQAAQEAGILKYSKLKDSVVIDWVKYKYKVLPRKTPPRSPRRGRSRSRPGRNGGGGRGGRACDRDRRPARSPRGGRAPARGGGRQAYGGDRGRGGRGREPERRPDRRRGRPASAYSYSYDDSGYSDYAAYSDEESYSPSPSPVRGGGRRSRSPPRRRRA